MKAALKYLFGSKRGVFFIAAVTAAVMMVSALIFAIPSIRWYLHVKEYLNDPPVFREIMGGDGDVNEYFEDMKQSDCFANTEITKPMFAALTAALICFVLMIKRLYGMYSANGVSRRTMTGVFFIAVPLAALAATAVIFVIRYALVNGTIFFMDEDYCSYNDYNMNITLLYPEVEQYDDPEGLYDEYYGVHRYYSEDDPKKLSEIVVDGINKSLQFKIYFRGALMFFALLTVIFSLTVSLFALFRRLGIYGVICGSLVIAVLYSFTALQLDTSGTLSKGFMKLFFHRTAFKATFYSSNKEVFYSPKALPVALAAIAICAAAYAVSRLSMRRSAVKRVM